MSTLNTVKPSVWETYERLSNLAFEAYRKTNKLVPCSDEWNRQVGLAQGYREAAIMVLDCC